MREQRVVRREEKMGRGGRRWWAFRLSGRRGHLSVGDSLPPGGAGPPGGARRPAATGMLGAPSWRPCGRSLRSRRDPLQQLPRPRRGRVAVVREGVGLDGGTGGFGMSPPCALPRGSSPGAAGLLLREHGSCVPRGGPASAPTGDCGGARPPRPAPQSCRSSWEGGSDRRLLPGGVWGP